MLMFKRTLLTSAIFTALAFNPQTLANVLLDSATDTDFEVIVVSGSKTEKPLKDVAGSISVLTEQELAKQVVNDMSQLFKYDPSIVVSGNTGGAQNFIVRGMGGDRILMIKDGMRMNEGYGANGMNDVVGRGFVETDILKQVEVAKGAASSLYGSDALGGIVVFTTKDAADYLSAGETFAGKVKLGYSELGQQSSIATTLALASGSFEHLLNISYRDGSEVQNFTETKVDLSIDSNSYFYKAKYKINDKDAMTFTADLWQQDVKGGIAYGLLSYFRDLEGYSVLQEQNDSEKDNRAFLLRYQNKSGSNYFDQLNVSLYRNTTEQEDVEYGQLDINANFGFPLIEIRDMWKTAVYQQKTTGLLSNASIKLNANHTLGYGVDIEQSESKRTEVKLYQVAGVAKNGYPQLSEKFPQTDVFRAGVFINDEISIDDGRLVITPGARFDRYEMEPSNALKSNGESYKAFNEHHLSLNLAGLYKITDSVAIFMQYGQGFKVPAYDLAYIAHDNSLYGYKIVPSEDLAPEASDTYEIGMRGHVDDLFFSSALYYTSYDDFLATQLIGVENIINQYTGQETPIQIYQYQNLDSVTIKGAEAAVRYHVNDRLSLFSNVSYQHGKDDGTGDYITSISPLSGTAGVSFDADNFSSEFIINWAERMDKVNSKNIEIAGFATLDWLMSYQINDDCRINVSARNLTDKAYVRYVNGAGHTDSKSLSYLTEAGRSFSANIDYRF